MRNKRLVVFVSALAIIGLVGLNAYARVDQILWNIVVKGNLTLLETFDFTDAVGSGASPLVFEGATSDAYETTLAITDPTADKTITFPDSDQTVGTATTIQDDLIVSADFADEDWGDMSVSTNSVTLDPGVVDTVELADDAVTSDKIAQSVIQTASVDIDSAGIKGLNTTPQELVAAPGAGKVIEFVSAVMILDYGTADYDTNGNLKIQTDTTNTVLSDTVAEGDFLFNSADSIVVVQALSADEQLDADEGLELVCETGDPATGDGTLTVKVTYRVLETGL